MEVENAVIPTAAQMEGFLSPDAGEPIFMVNLLKFRERAEYEDGRGSELSGREAYQIYACLLYTSPSPRDMRRSRMPSSA